MVEHSVHVHYSSDVDEAEEEEESEPAAEDLLSEEDESRLTENVSYVHF